MLTSPWNSPVPRLKATVRLAEDRYNPHKEQPELNTALPLVKFPWKKCTFFKKKSGYCKNQEEKNPGQVDWNFPAVVKPSTLCTPISQKSAAQLGRHVSDLGVERGAQASAKGAASNQERSPLASLTTKPRCMLSPGGRNNFHVWKSPFMKGGEQRRGCPSA